MTVRPIVLVTFLLTALSLSQAQHAEHTHSETLGTVHFQTSCSPSVQPQFNRAVALLHSFQFAIARDALQSVLTADSSCTIAYWGIALSHWANPFAAAARTPAQLAAGRAAVEQGRAHPPQTPRERAWIEAVAQLFEDAGDHHTRQLKYESAMASLSAAYPDDTEAQIFYALAIAAAADPGDKTYARQLKAGAILDRLFVQYSDHPGLAHYIIHTYDVPALASRAAHAAQRYSAIAPSTAHALHMPSHTFTRLGDWQSSIDSNLASAKAAQNASQPAEELHASDYLVYAYLQMAQDAAARTYVESAAQAFAHYDPATARSEAAGPPAAFFAHAAIPARYCLERHDWACAAGLEPLPSAYLFTDAITWFARGLGSAHLGHLTETRAAIAALSQIHEKLLAANEKYWANQVEIQREQLGGWLAFAEGHTPEALAQLRQAAEAEDKTEKNVVTPGPLAPAREQLGDVLLQLKRSAEALPEYEAALTREPNRFWSLYGAAQAASLSGKTQAARDYAQKLLNITVHADSPGRPELAALRPLANPASSH